LKYVGTFLPGRTLSKLIGFVQNKKCDFSMFEAIPK